MLSIMKNLARVHLFFLCTTYPHEGQQIANVIVRQRMNKAQFIQGRKRMLIRIGQQFVYLLRREKRQLTQFLFRRGIEIDRRLMKRIEVRLQLLIIHLTHLRRRAIDIQNNIIKVVPRNDIFGTHTIYRDSAEKQRTCNIYNPHCMLHGTKVQINLHICKKSSNFVPF